MTINQVLVIILAILLIWWPIGGLINRRRGQAWMDWLNAGSNVLGTSSSQKWLRSFQSVGQLSLRNVQAPFRSMEILFTLESRDNLIMWILRHLRGRRDEMILQANLLSNPVQELEIGALGRRSYDAYLAKQKDDPFTQLPEQGGFHIARRGGNDPGAIAYLRKFLTAEGQVIQRMSLQRRSQVNQSLWLPREANNLLLRADMTMMDAQSPAAFFTALREWAAEIAVENEEQVENPTV
jgi:hypothetical protein